MGDLTKNLSRHEFACRCGCGEDTADYRLVTVIQEGCDYFSTVYGEKVGVNITGPNRCRLRNKTEGGVDNSQHIWHRACDHHYFIKSTGRILSTDEVADYYNHKFQGIFGIGRYPNGRVHLDTRTNGFARWDYRNKYV